MPTHRPSRPYSASLLCTAFTAPLRLASPLVVLSAVTVLTNIIWGGYDKPDPPDGQPLQHPDPSARSGSQTQATLHHTAKATRSTGSPVSAVPASRPVDDPSVSITSISAADGGSDVAGPGCDENSSGGSTDIPGFATTDPAVGGVDDQTATARWFVTAALQGQLGDPHQQAAQTAVTVATEHGFLDDPTRVAEALVVFLHPDHR